MRTEEGGHRANEVSTISTHTAHRAIPVPRRIARQAVVGAWLFGTVRTSPITSLADPGLFITDVQRLMRHRSINSTQIYARAGIDDLVVKMKDHYARPEPSAPRSDPAYDPEAMAVLFPELA